MRRNAFVGPRAALFAAALALAACGPVVSPTSFTPASVRWRAALSVPGSRLVDANARPQVEGLLRVGEQALIHVDTEDGNFLGITPTLTWNVSNPAVLTVNGSGLGLVRAVAPGEAQVTATVLYSGTASQASLFWCQPPPGGGPGNPFPGSQCTWIPVSAIRVVP